MGKLPSTLLRRPSVAAAPSLPSTSSAPSRHALLPHHTPAAHPSQQPQIQTVQVRHATFVPRSRRPYQFTQLVQLSDGSTFTVRTTSPVALYKSAKDSRNHILWQPSNKTLRNVEVDEAGKLAAFRERYGNAWNLDGPGTGAAAATAKAQPAAAAGAGAGAGAGGAEEGVKGKAGADAKKQAPAEAAPAAPEEDPFDSLVDLISAYATEDKNVKGGLSAKEQAKKDKTKKK